MAIRDLIRVYCGKVKNIILSPQTFAFFPAILLLAYWLGGENALIFTAVLHPVIVILMGGFESTIADSYLTPTNFDGMLDRENFNTLVAKIYSETQETMNESALFHILIDDYASIIELHGQSAGEALIQQTGDRILSVLRDIDCAARLGECRFAICLGASRKMDLEACIQLAGRIQAIIEEPVIIDGLTLYVTCAVGFCQSNRIPNPSAEQWAQSSATALIEANKNGPASIRAYTEEMRRVSKVRTELREEVSNALETGQITPWFQPQISTDTGEVSGFEALARWFHPERGMISPAEFLPAIEQAGLLERLAEIMIYHSFTALKAWEAAQIYVPHIGVNFSGAELNNPRLVEKIKWELDRFGLSADRLSVEILETVISNGPYDQITQNINNLMALGCHIDLDDFGTGHASISSIRRFKINRLKIDRSFVMKVDKDPEQQRMISAIITMAERLNLDILAEGVETPGEHAIISQLGCTHVQGYGIGKPMPFQDTLTWIRTHNAKLPNPPKIAGRKTK